MVINVAAQVYDSNYYFSFKGNNDLCCRDTKLN